MEPIDISNRISDFRQVFEKESRIIFSARFGDGKSYFLNQFIKSYPKASDDYYFITLHPVNYVVEENRDVIEYIKRDILFQLIKDGKIYDYIGTDDKVFNAVCNRESIARLADFLASIFPIDGLKNGIESAKKLLETVREKYDEQSDVKAVDSYLNGFYGMNGSICECDAFTCLIQKTLEHQLSKTVLIIEDLDRIDPAHLFRIMNVLSSQVDNPYYIDCYNGNKFGFDKIILVMDYDITKHIFQHFYGKEANYEGYMNKFLNSVPFKFSILEEAQMQVKNKLTQVFGTSDVLKISGALYPYMSNSDTFNLQGEIEKLSVRRCKEFIDDNLEIHIRKRWKDDGIKLPTDIDIVKLLYSFRFIMGLPLNAIYGMLIECLQGELAVKMLAPLFCINNRKRYFAVRVDNEIYECHYVEKENVFTVEQTDTWDDTMIVDFDKVKGAARNMNIKNAVLDLIIG